MKYHILFFILLLATIGLKAQTKLIHHKSHSGSRAAFAKAYAGNLFDLRESNFGVAPTTLVVNAELDSVIFLSDTAAVMVTSEHCKEYARSSKKLLDTTLWKAGRDTVFFHPLFTQPHQLDSIKRVLDASYHFQNPASEVVFVGYDNETPVPPVPKDTAPLGEEKKQQSRKEKKRQGKEVRKSHNQQGGEEQGQPKGKTEEGQPAAPKNSGQSGEYPAPPQGQASNESAAWTWEWLCVAVMFLLTWLIRNYARQ